MLVVPNRSVALQNLKQINRVEVSTSPEQCSCSNCTCSANCSVTSFYEIKTSYDNG